MEGPWLELLVVEEADGNGDGICMCRRSALSSLLPTEARLIKQDSCHRQMHLCSHSCLLYVAPVMIRNAAGSLCQPGRFVMLHDPLPADVGVMKGTEEARMPRRAHS